MTSLADKLAAQQKRPGTACFLGKYVDELSADEKADFLGAFYDDDRISASVLSNYLMSIGQKITINQIGVHRRNLCRSCRDTGRLLR